MPAQNHSELINALCGAWREGRRGEVRSAIASAPTPALAASRALSVMSLLEVFYGCEDARTFWNAVHEWAHGDD
jgi:hypothetical protein